MLLRLHSAAAFACLLTLAGPFLGSFGGSLAATLQAADHRVEANDAKVPDELSKAIAEQLEPKGIKVIRGTSRTVCEIWLTKQWPVKALKASGDVNYPFSPGQLIGVIRYPRRGADFRDQDIDSGVYTLRYGQQPVDGAHVGTSPTRDFLLLVRAADDKTTELMAYKPLAKASAEAAQTAHPALLSLQKVVGDGKAPSIRHNEDHDWWLTRLSGKAVAGDKDAQLVFDLVVVGTAAE